MKNLIDRDELVRIYKKRRAFYCDDSPKSFSLLSYEDKSRVDMLDTCIADAFNIPSVQPKTDDILSYIDRISNSGLGKKKALEYLRKYVEKSAE